MKRLYKPIVALCICLPLCSFIHYEQTYMFQYYKVELTKNLKLTSEQWGRRNQSLRLISTEQGIDVVINNSDVFKFEELEDHGDFKDAQGYTIINGEAHECEIVINNEETHDKPQTKIIVHRDRDMIITKYWQEQPAGFLAGR